MALTRKRALAIFKMLGEKGAEAAAWADGETTDNEPYLARWLFLKALWSDVIAEDDGWMNEWSSKKHPVPAAIARMLAKGIGGLASQGREPLERRRSADDRYGGIGSRRPAERTSSFVPGFPSGPAETTS